MTWTRLSDDFADHPELALVSRSARLLHVEALVYGNRHGNDGRFRRGIVRRMTDADDLPDLVAELLEHGIWSESDDGFVIDWDLWAQEPAEVVRERRDANAERNKAYRERGRRHRDNDHSMCTDKCPKKTRDVSRDTSHDGTRDDTPIRPVPARPQGRKGNGEAEQGGSAGATPPDRPEDDPADWSRFPEVELAHKYVSNPADNSAGRCFYAIRLNSGEVAPCGLPPTAGCHGHAYKPTQYPNDMRCDFCDGPQTHAVHPNRRECFS